jgi:hypothetical protein
MDILLAHAYTLYDDPHERKVMKPYPPLGILYLSSYLKSRGYSVGVYDSTFKSQADFDAALVERVMTAKFDHRGGEWTKQCAERFEAAADPGQGKSDKAGLAAALAQLAEGRRLMRGDLVTQYMTLEPMHVSPAVASALADALRAADADGLGDFGQE